MRMAMMLFVILFGSIATWAQTEQIYSGFTATAGTAGYTNQSYGNLVDGKFTSAYFSKWCLSMSSKIPLESADSCVYCDFQADQAIAVTKYILTTGEDNSTYTNRNPKRWALQAKLNSTDEWVTIDSIYDGGGLQNVNYTDYEFTLSNPGTYQYFRFMVFETQGAGTLQLSELRFKGPLQTATLSGTGTESDPFIIANVAGWNTFVSNVNAGNDADKYYKLADGFIDTTPIVVMAGTNDNPFTGHFNGNGKILNVNISGTEIGAAPFRYINGATIEMLTVAGTVTSTAYHAAGLVGMCKDDNANVISNCDVQVNVIASGYAGGIIGHGGNGTLTMSGCIYSGNISKFTSFAGGLVGWCDNVTITMTNCLFKGSFSAGTNGKYHPIACHTANTSATATCTNVYYTGDDATAGSSNWVSGANGIKVTSSTPTNTMYLKLNAADGNSYYSATSVSGVEPFYELTGSVIQPIPVVKLSDGSTVSSSCYTVTYSGDGTTSGNYSVSISGVSSKGYEGTTTINYDVTYEKPTNLAVSLTCAQPTQATISWTENGSATQWKICLNGDETNAITVNSNPYTLTGLEADHGYNVKVCAVRELGDSYWTNEVYFMPTAKVTVGTGTDTHSELPLNCYYNYSLTEQIFTPEELEGSVNAGKAIASIAFYCAKTPECNLDIYIVHTDKSSFSSGSDWIVPTVDDKVFSGTVSFLAESWKDITLDTPFIYDGTSNIAIIVDNNTGSYTSTTNFLAYTATGNQALYIRSDGTNYDPMSPAVSGTLLAKKNQMRVLFEDAPSCIRPTELTASELAYNDNTGTYSDTITWTSSADAWNLRYKLKDATTWTTVAVANTPSYLLTGLVLASTYEVQVQTDCGSGSTSGWTNSLLLTTPLCGEPDKNDIRYELTDSYGDGWNGNKIQVVHHNSGIVVAELTIESGDSAEGTVALCCGEDYDFVWLSGSFASECSYVFYDINDEEIFSGSDALSDTVSYTMDCTITSCKKPMNLKLVSTPGPKSVKLQWTPGTNDQTTWDIAYMADGEADFTLIEEITNNPYTLTGLDPETDYTVKVRGNCGGGDVSTWSNELTFTTNTATPTPLITNVEVGPNTAEISWLDWTDEYQVRYAPLSGGITLTDEALLQYDNDNYYSLYGTSSTNTWTWGVMYPGNLVTGNVLTGISIYEKSTYNTEDITIKIYSGGDNAPGTLLYTETVTPEANDDFHDITFASPQFIATGQNLWITLTETGTYVMDVCDDGSEVNNLWLYDADDDEWTALNASGVGWMIRGNMATTDIDIDNMAWTTITCDEDTCLLTGLQTETDYIYQVRGNYGADGYSAWTTGFFITTNDNPVVHNVEVTPSNTSATISWTGYSDSYKVRYRNLAYESLLSTSFSDDFESGDLDKWTIIRNNEGIDETDWSTIEPANYFSSTTVEAHSGDYVAMSRSWYSNTEYDVENWLISPAIPLTGKLTYWAMGDAGYPEHYDVYVSTTTNDINEFVKVYEPDDVTDSWTKHTVDLSSYNGAMGYIAFCNADYDKDYLLVDDVVVAVSESTPAGDWQEINTTASSIELTGLTSDVEYEYQIIGIKAGQPNSETNIATFKTTKTSFDLNGDGRLDGADVKSLADIVVGNLNASSYPMSTIDINNDGVITIADITALVNKILNIVP